MPDSIFNTLAFLSLFVLSCCNNNPEADPLETYRVEGTLPVDGYNRTYLLNLPPGYYEDTARYALVIGLHGTGGSAAQFDNDYGFTDLAKEAHFAIVYPEGVHSDGILGIRTWNAGTCCDYAMEHDIDDVKFISNLIDELLASYAIDPQRVYVTGMSNGAMLTYRLVCELSDKIAAATVVSGTLMTDRPCHPSRPVPLLHIHSELDTKVPPQGGTGLAGYYFHPVDSALQVVSSEYRCAAPQAPVDNGRYIYKTWTTCENEVVMQYYLTHDGGHAWPGGKPASMWADTPSTAINATRLAWDFFVQHGRK